MQNDRNAIVKWINYKKTSYNGFDKAVKYVTNVKAAPKEYTYFQHLNPDTAVQDLQVVEDRYGKPENSRLYKHLVCSFGDPDLKAEEAYRFMKDLLAPFAKVYPVLFSIHTNIPRRVHAHALIGMTNLFTGKKFSQGSQDLLKFRKDYDALATDYHLPLLRQRCPPQQMKASIEIPNNNNLELIGEDTMQEWNYDNGSTFSNDAYEGGIILTPQTGYQPNFQGPMVYQQSPRMNPMPSWSMPPGAYSQPVGYSPQGACMPQRSYPPQDGYPPQGGYMPQGFYQQRSGYPSQGMYPPQYVQAMPGNGFYEGYYHLTPMDCIMIGGMMIMMYLDYSNGFSQPAITPAAPVAPTSVPTPTPATPVIDCTPVSYEPKRSRNQKNPSDEKLPEIHGYRGIFDDKAYGVYTNLEAANESWGFWRHKSRHYQDFSNYDDAYHFALEGLASIRRVPANAIPVSNERRLNYRNIAFRDEGGN